VRDFAVLLQKLPGVFPTSAMASVHRLAKASRIRAAVALSMERQARSRTTFQPSLRSALPPAHPLDFEWRFTRNTGRLLLERAAGYARTGEKILLLGTATLAAMAAKSLPQGSCIYVGEDNDVTRSVAAVNARMSHPLDARLCGPGSILASETAVVVVDPPWYFDFYRPMLSAAAFACRPGGRILVSLPPPGTNSHVQKDRAKLFSLFSRLSLNVVSITPDLVFYDTPFFEANALAAQGYTNIPKTWRRGDLFLLEKAVNAPDFTLGTPVRRRAWHEISIGRMRVFVRKGATHTVGPMDELIPLVPGDVLDSVKRTDPRRGDADVWTSGNRIFAASRPDLVRIAAEHRAAGGFLSAATRLLPEEYDAVERLSYVLGELALKEQREERRDEFVEATCRTVPFKSKSLTSPIASRIIRSGAGT
jgi:hypothetical protein